MILNYIDPKFCNIISLQSNLGDFSKDLAVLIFKSKLTKKDRLKVDIKDTTVQTTLDDFGLKTFYKKVVTSYNHVYYNEKIFNIVNLDYWIFNHVDKDEMIKMGEFNENKTLFYNKVNKALYNDSVDSINENVHILSDGSFEMLNPKCTKCGSLDIIKKDIVEFKPKVEYHSNMKLRLKRYYCKKL